MYVDTIEIYLVYLFRRFNPEQKRSFVTMSDRYEGRQAVWFILCVLIVLVQSRKMPMYQWHSYELKSQINARSEQITNRQGR